MHYACSRLFVAAALTTVMPSAPVRREKPSRFPAKAPPARSWCGPMSGACISSPGKAAPFATPSAWAAPTSNGLGRQRSPASTSVRPGRRRPRSDAAGRITSYRQARRAIRWAPPRSCWRTTSWRSMAPTTRARSAALCLGAAFACTTKTSWISTSGVSVGTQVVFTALKRNAFADYSRRRSAMSRLRRGARRSHKAPRAARWRQRDSAGAALPAPLLQTAP